MKFIPLIWKNVWRRKFRTTFTLLSIFVAFLLFGILMTIRAAFSIGVELAGQDRLVLIHKVSLINPLPVSYMPRLANTPGVTEVTHNSWFGGVYQDPSQFFARIAVLPEQQFSIYTEFKVPPDQLKAFMADRQGAIAGRTIAERYGWKIGDRIPIKADIWQPKDGSGVWEFNLVGIYDGAKGVDLTNFFFRYDYLDENRQDFAKGLVGWYIVKIADPSRSAEMARQFDDMFANSEYETRTTTEKGFIDGFAKQIGDIGAIMIAILVAVLFTILLVVANTMAQSVRERTSELAVLKTLGFSNTAVLAIVLAESVFIAVIGGGLGLLAAWAFVQTGDPTNGALPLWLLPSQDLVLGAGLMLLLGVLAGALPAIQAMQLKITDALRRN